MLGARGFPYVGLPANHEQDARKHAAERSRAHDSLDPQGESVRAAATLANSGITRKEAKIATISMDVAVTAWLGGNLRR